MPPIKDRGQVASARKDSWSTRGENQNLEFRWNNCTIWDGWPFGWLVIPSRTLLLQIQHCVLLIEQIGFGDGTTLKHLLSVWTFLDIGHFTDRRYEVPRGLKTRVCPPAISNLSITTRLVRIWPTPTRQDPLKYTHAEENCAASDFWGSLIEYRPAGRIAEYVFSNNIRSLFVRDCGRTIIYGLSIDAVLQRHIHWSFRSIFIFPIQCLSTGTVPYHVHICTNIQSAN